MSRSGDVSREHQEVSHKRVREEVGVRNDFGVFALFSCGKLACALESEFVDQLRQQCVQAFLVFDCDGDNRRMSVWLVRFFFCVFLICRPYGWTRNSQKVESMHRQAYSYFTAEQRQQIVFDADVQMLF